MQTQLNVNKMHHTDASILRYKTVLVNPWVLFFMKNLVVAAQQQGKPLSRESLKEEMGLQDMRWFFWNAILAEAVDAGLFKIKSFSILEARYVPPID